MKLGYIYAGKVIGNLSPGGVDPYTLEPSEHLLQCDLGKDGAITGLVCPLTVVTDSTKNWYPDDHASTIDGDVYGLYVRVQIGEEPTHSNALLRLEANTKGITLGSAIQIPIAGIPVGDISYLFEIPQTPKLAWSANGTPTNIDGWFRINMGGVDRWIALYDTTP